MAVGFKIDNETLAMSVIIGAGLLYYFTHDQLTEAEVTHKRDEDRKGIAARNLDVLEHRFEALQMEDSSPEEPLPDHISTSLKLILEDVIRLQSESMDIAGIGETFFEHTAHLIQSGRHYLGRHAEHVADVEAHKAHQKGPCALTNVAKVTNVAVIHNHFDQRTQHQTSVLAVQDARKVILMNDARSHTFNQQNNELKQVNLRNPHSDDRGSDVRVQGGESTHSLLTHVTNEGTHSQSVLDQQQTNRDNIVVHSAVTACSSGIYNSDFPRLGPTKSEVLLSRHRGVPVRLSHLSTQASAHSKEVSDRIGQMRGKGVALATVHEVDIFNQSPVVQSDNHDMPPGNESEPTSGGASLTELSSNETAMFDEGGKSGKKTTRSELRTEGAPPKKKIKSIPASPSEQGFPGAKIQAAKIEIREFAAKADMALMKLDGVTEYNRAIVQTIQTLIAGIDYAMYKGGTPEQRETWNSVTRQSFIARLNKHKKRFGRSTAVIAQKYY